MAEYDPFKDGFQDYEKEKAAKEAAAKAALETPAAPSADAVALAEEKKRREQVETDLRTANASHDRRLDQFNAFLTGTKGDKGPAEHNPTSGNRRNDAWHSKAWLIQNISSITNTAP